MDQPRYHGRQVTAARALAGATIAELADEARVTVRTLWRIEKEGLIRISPGRRHGHVSEDVWRRIIEALAQRGVELIEGGARWVVQRPRKDTRSET